MTLVWIIVIVALGLVAFGFVWSWCVIGARDDARMDELLDEEKNLWPRRLGTMHVMTERRAMLNGASVSDWLGTAAAAASSAALKLERVIEGLSDDLDADIKRALNDLNEASEHAALVRDQVAGSVDGRAGVRA